MQTERQPLVIRPLGELQSFAHVYFAAAQANGLQAFRPPAAATATAREATKTRAALKLRTVTLKPLVPLQTLLPALIPVRRDATPVRGPEMCCAKLVLAIATSVPAPFFTFTNPIAPHCVCFHFTTGFSAPDGHLPLKIHPAVVNPPSPTDGGCCGISPSSIRLSRRKTRLANNARARRRVARRPPT